MTSKSLLSVNDLEEAAHSCPVARIDGSQNRNAAMNAEQGTLEHIYIGQRFKNDTERREKTFDLYTTMTAKKILA
jgi:hypothetical protein